VRQVASTAGNDCTSSFHDELNAIFDELLIRDL